MNMKKWIIGMMMMPLSVVHGQTLEECQQAAERNYPLIRQYGLIEKTAQLTVSSIRKGWLPQVSVSAQATLQSDVSAWPDQMQTMLAGMGVDIEGLKKDQYRVGIDVQQVIFDGGVFKYSAEIARQQGEVQIAQNEVNMYQVRKRVNEMYFAWLLIEEQMKLNSNLQELLASNEKKLASMFERGTAAESDYLNVKAERLNVVQQKTSLEAQRSALMRMLSAFCGMEMKAATKPVLSVATTQQQTQRPELHVIDAQLKLADTKEKALDAALRPKVGVFAQGFYGYPGYNMFEDMMRRRFSWNGMIGARLTWNIGALYTHKNDKATLNAQRSLLSTQRDVFLFHNNLEQIQQNENIERYQKMMTDDDEIIALRSSIRKAAESKLSHGIIDVNDLVREINAENAARVQQTVHEIEMLKECYDLRFTKGGEWLPIKNKY